MILSKGDIELMETITIRKPRDRLEVIPTRFLPYRFMSWLCDRPELFLAVIHEQHSEFIFHHGSCSVLLIETMHAAHDCGLDVQRDPNGEWRRILPEPSFKEQRPSFTDRPWIIWAERTRRDPRGPAVPDRLTVKWERWLPAGARGAYLLETEEHERSTNFLKERHPGASLAPVVHTTPGLPWETVMRHATGAA